MLEDLKSLMVAQTTSPFSAPAIIDPTIAAVVILTLGQSLSGEEQRNPAGAQIFRDKMGRAVLHHELSLEDDPTLESFGGLALAGRYEFDEQGLPAQKVVLIDKGVLQGFLLSRYPVIGFPRSNGHGRGLPGTLAQGFPGTLILRSSQGLSQERLLGLLREECHKRGKPYGLWGRKLRTFFQNQAASGHSSMRLMPGLLYLVEATTGRLTLVRDLDMVGTPLALVNNILKAGDDSRAHNLMARVPVSVVVPSLLLGDVELQRAQTKPEKAPILSPPSAPLRVRGARFVPTIPVVTHVQVQRYLLRGVPIPLPSVLIDKLKELERRPQIGALRQRPSGRDLILEVMVAGRTLRELGESLYAVDSAVEALGPRGTVEKSVLSSAMTKSSYKALYGEGWPQKP
jgi:hypothetical protein